MMSAYTERMASYIGTARVALHSAGRQLEMAQEYAVANQVGGPVVDHTLDVAIDEALAVLSILRVRLDNVVKAVHA
jgi:hypothetical protein